MAEQEGAGQIEWRLGQAVCALVAPLMALGASSTAREAFLRFSAGQWDEAWSFTLATALFGVAGAVLTAIFVFAWRMARRARAIESRRALHPHEPWLWTEEWQDGHIQADSEWTIAAAFGAFSILWGGLVAGGALFAHQTGRFGATPGLVPLFVVAAVSGLFMVVYASHRALVAVRYRPAVLEMSTLPGVLGGRLQGVVRLPEGLAHGGEATVALSCHRTTAGPANQKSSSSTTWLLWRDENAAQVPPSGEVPVSFTVPFDLPASAIPWTRRRSVSWTLTVATHAADYRPRFEVPVFKTVESDPNVQEGTVDPSRPAVRPAGAKTRIVDARPGVTVFTFPPPKGLAFGIAALFLAPLAAWAAVRYAGIDIEKPLVLGTEIGAAILLLIAVSVLLTATC